MGIKEAVKNIRLGHWIDTGDVPVKEIVAAAVAVKDSPKTSDKSDGIAIVDADELRNRVNDTVKGSVLTGVGLTVLAAGLGRALLSPSGIIGMGMIVGGGVTTAVFGGKTVVDYVQIRRKLKK